MQRRCIIFTAYIRGNVRDAYTLRENDFVLCADGGYAHAIAAGVTPSLVIGDCDSTQGTDIPAALLHRVPVEKDDTDTMLCVRYAAEQGYTECILLGGIGGRLDHTLANLQTLAFAQKHGMHAVLCDAFDQAFLLENSEILLPKKEGATLSLFSFSEQCSGVYISGVKYPLVDATLTNDFPLGVSNAFAAPEARVSVREGLLLIVLSQLER